MLVSFNALTTFCFMLILGGVQNMKQRIPINSITSQFVLKSVYAFCSTGPFFAELFHVKRNLCNGSQIIMHEIICPWIQYINLLQFLLKEELALKVFIWERKNKDISVKTHTFARPLASINNDSISLQEMFAFYTDTDMLISVRHNNASANQIVSRMIMCAMFLSS